MLWVIAVVLVLLWLAGFVLNVAGSLIHLVLVLAILVAIYSFVKGRRTA